MSMLEVITDQSYAIKTLFSVLKNIIPTANIEFVSDGAIYLKINEINSDKTLLVNVKLDGGNFSKFVCNQSNVTCGVDLNMFYNQLKDIQKNSTLKLSMDQSNKHLLNLKANNSSGGICESSITNLDYLPKNNINIPKTTYDVLIKMDSKSFHKQFSEMYTFAEYVEIEYDDGIITFTCNREGSTKKITFSENTSQFSYSNPHSKHVYGIFELKPLVLLSKLGPLCNTVDIYMKNDFPITIKYTVGTLGRAYFLLTPIDSKEKPTRKKPTNEINNEINSEINSEINNEIYNDIDTNYSFEICI